MFVIYPLNTHFLVIHAVLTLYNQTDEHFSYYPEYRS